MGLKEEMVSFLQGQPEAFDRMVDAEQTLEGQQEINLVDKGEQARTYGIA